MLKMRISHEIAVAPGVLLPNSCYPAAVGGPTPRPPRCDSRLPLEGAKMENFCGVFRWRNDDDITKMTS